MSDSEVESESSFLKEVIKRKLQKGLTPTTTKLIQADGSVEFLEKQGSSKCTDADMNKKYTYGFVVDNTPDLSIGCVLHNWLFVSSQDVANDLNLIQQHKITHILSLLPEFKLNPEIKAICEHLSLAYYDETSFSITNLETLEALEFIYKVKSTTNTNGKVLVHCNAGISRSPTIIILYLMKYEHFSYDEAFKMVKSVRPKIKPNDGFSKQLKQYKIN